VRRLAIAAVIAALSACGARPTTKLPPAAAPAHSPSSGTRVAAADVGGTVPSAPPLSFAAEQAAAAYATAALSYSFDAGPSAWVDAVSAICTPSWLAHLRSERSVPPDWAGVVTRREVAVASVLAVHASASAGAVQRAVVALAINVDGEARSRRTAVVEVELVSLDGRWLVASDG